MKGWSVERKVFGGFAVALLVLVVVGSFAFYNGAMVISGHRLVRHTQEVLAQLGVTYSTVQDAETNQRGYLLTGEESYLAPYRADVQTVSSHLAILRKMTADNPRQNARVNELEGLIGLRLRTLEETLNVRETEGYEAAARIVSSGRGQRQMAAVRAMVADMEAEERRLLEERAAASDESSRGTIRASLVSVVLVGILLAIAYRVIKRDMAERKRTERALQESEERFRRLSNASREGVCIHEGGKILEVNKRVAEMFGYELDEVAGMNMWAFTPFEYQNAIMGKAMAEDETPYELVGVRKDGSVFPIEVSGQTVPYQGRDVRVTTTRDLTEQKHAEEVLKRSEREYRGLFENAHDAILLLSIKDEIVLDANAAACKLFGFAQEELIGMPAVRLSGDSARISNADARWLENGGTLQYEAVQYRKDGTEISLEITAAMVEYKGQRAYLRVKRDVTERKRAEEALRASEQKYRLLMEGATDSVVLIDRNGNYLEANDTACRTLGYTREEFLKLNMKQMVAPEELDARSLVEDRRAARKGLLVERTMLRKDGTRVMVEISSRLLDDGSVQAIVRDVTERKRAEEALQVLATQDALTGLLNRHEMDRVLSEEATRCRRYGRSMSLVMIDIDHFKSVNDRYGHKVGDEVLRWIGGIFRDNVRSTDRVARYGGEEIAAILPETDDVEARLVAERFRSTVAAQPFTYTTPDGEVVSIPITISLGVAELPSDAITADALLVAADNALYHAKRSGRNQVVSYSSSRDVVTGERVAS
ncbi:MAG: PAS domain S-box protein [Chloroflexota bacterium]|nr:PAS domain S-box protein [Chloroflexota bacterium]MDQ5865391.1 PAS domain S-box protein [Chloroflexota bacterium]